MAPGSSTRAHGMNMVKDLSPRGLKSIIQKNGFFIDFQWFQKEFEGFDKAMKGLKPYQMGFDEGERVIMENGGVLWGKNGDFATIFSSWNQKNFWVKKGNNSED